MRYQEHRSGCVYVCGREGGGTEGEIGIVCVVVVGGCRMVVKYVVCNGFLLCCDLPF